MATRSRIGRTNEDGSITSIYVHWNGSPGDQGPILLARYNTPERLKQLLDLGDLSALAPEIGERQDFDAPTPAGGRVWCLAYGRDRGDAGTQAVKSANLVAFEALADTCGAEYLYLMQDGVWQVCRTPACGQEAWVWRGLVDALKEEAARPARA